MKFSSKRVVKYIEAVQKRLNATSKEVGKNYVNFIDASNKTIIGFYFDIDVDDDVYTLVDLYFGNDFYPLVQNKVISINKMIKAVENASRTRCIQENMKESFKEYEDSLA